MTEEGKDTEEERGGARQRMGDGIRSGLGVLGALKDALEETIQEARERGDLSAERAREIVKEAVVKAQEAATGARERLDFANHTELEALADRVSALEKRVFGEDGDTAQEEEEPDEPEEGSEPEASSPDR